METELLIGWVDTIIENCPYEMGDPATKQLVLQMLSPIIADAMESQMDDPVIYHMAERLGVSWRVIILTPGPYLTGTHWEARFWSLPDLGPMQ